MSSEHPREKGWYVADRFTYLIHRGPYKYAETAGAVRAEMERYKRYDHMNLWPIDEKMADKFDQERFNATLRTTT
jgi:hypothetical protein